MRSIKGLFINLLQKLFLIFNIKNNKILFMSNNATSYSCNPRYLAEYLIMKNKYDIIWVFNSNVIDSIEIPSKMRKVKYMSLRYFYEISTSKIIVSNNRCNFFKRKDQRYIQTWHSSLRLKKIEKDAQNNLSSSYINMAKIDSKNIDIIISGCDFSTNFFLNSFWYSGKIAKTGTPRIDYIMNGNSKRLNILRKSFRLYGRKIVLYAPTFRNNQDINFYNIEINNIINQLNIKYQKDFIVLVKLHPNLINEQNKLRTNENVVNVMSGYDIQELIMISDIVITDYSSLMFDCAFVCKPCILYMPDYDEYITRERELYFNINELPFPFALSVESLKKCIMTFEDNTYCRNIEHFMRKVGSYEDGHACERIEKIIEEYIKI